MIKVIFGSKSDNNIFDEINSELNVSGAKYEFQVCSAHRNPARLADILAEKHDLVIAGAGLAAHLPGVVASKTTKPVIGVPCSGNFEGLDALLSIFQMPPGIPVLGVGVDNAEEAAKNALKIVNNKWKNVNIVNRNLSDKLVEKAEKMLEKIGIEADFSEEIVPEAINILCVPLDSEVDASDTLVINVPVFSGETAMDAVKYLELAKKGLWVGLNRIDNAIVAAAEIMNYNLDKFRNDMKK